MSAQAAFAPKCKRCNRPTWNPDGLCFDHTNSTGNDSTARNKFNVAQSGVTPSSGYQSAQVERDFRHVFPEASPEVNTFAIHSMARRAVRETVSIEMMRRIPETDHADPRERAKRVRALEDQIVGEIEAHDVQMSASQALGLRNSSIDEFGIGFEEGMGVASYALMLEQQLGRANNEKWGDACVFYSLDADEYARKSGERLRTSGRIEFRRQLAFYPNMVFTATGRPPLNPEPVLSERSKRILFDSDMLIADQLDETGGRGPLPTDQEKQSVSKEEVVGGALGVIASLASYGLQKRQERKEEIRQNVDDIYQSAHQRAEAERNRKYKEAVIESNQRARRNKNKRDSWF